MRWLRCVLWVGYFVYKGTLLDKLFAACRNKPALQGQQGPEVKVKASNTGTRKCHYIGFRKDFLLVGLYDLLHQDYC